MKSRDSENLKRAKTNFDNPKIWKDSEIAFIRKNIDTMTNKELADHLNTSLDTVKMKIRKERIIRKNFKRPVNEIKNEKWITIKSATRYSVSNFGRVKHDLENFLVSVYVLETGYLQVNLVKNNGERKPFRIHRLVAKAFVFKPKSEEVLEVNHIDGVKKNNCASNLEWVTKRENIIHAIRNGLIKPPILIGEDASKASLTTKQVHKICKLIENGYRNKEISEMFEIKKSNIVGQIRRRKTWTHISKDYKW